MLTIPTYLDKSAVHGIGLFANANIPNGTLIWKHNKQVDLSFTPAQWEALKQGIHSNSFAAILNLCSKAENKYHVSFDNAQFMNHAPYESANVGFKDQTFDEMIAIRDIELGEEIFCDYTEYSDPDCPVVAGLNLS